MSVPRLSRRPGGRPTLIDLVTSPGFRLGPRTARVASNLALHGGRVDERGPAWIGDDLPPLGAPSVTLGEARGTLGPHSFGFLDNVRGVALFAAPLPARPRIGPVALVCARREALLDVGPLVVARDLGVSWLLSVGDGDPGEALELCAADEHTRVVLFAPGAGARPESPRAAGDKQVAILGGAALVRAAVRRAGGLAADDLEEWLAFGRLAEVNGTPLRPRALCTVGGAAQLAELARAAHLELPVITVDDDDIDALPDALREAAGDADLVLAFGLPALADRPSLILDATAPDRVRALFGVLATRLAPPPAPIPRVRVEKRLVESALREAADPHKLSDHDLKRLLKAYGVNVSRQAPAQSANAALMVAKQIGFPVDVVADGAPPREAKNASDVRRIAGVLLDRAPFVLVRERFPLSPRSRLEVRREPIGLVARIGEQSALLPLERPDAIHLANTTAGDDTRALVDILARSTAAASELELDLDLEIYVGTPPAIVAAAGKRR